MDYNPEDLGPFHERLRAPGEKLIAEATALARGNYQPPRNLYHYTNMQGLMGIVDSKTLWATDARYLKDAQETIWAKAIFDATLAATETRSDAERELIARLHGVAGFADIGFRIFCASFSESEDDLNQWRGYGTNGGVCIHVNGEHLSWKLRGYELLPVLYDHEEQKNIAKSIVDMLLAYYREHDEGDTPISGNFYIPHCLQIYRQSIIYATLRFKSYHWSSEKEWRFIAALSGQEIQDSEWIGFRVGPLGITPYLKMDLSQGPLRPGMPIETLTIGPSTYPDLVEEAVNLYLGKNGHNLFYGEIKHSTVPLRSR